MAEQAESFCRIMSITDAIEELVYNSLEAHCTSIVVQVHLNKFKFQIIDNGVGLTADQAKNIAVARGFFISTNVMTSLSAVIRLAAEVTIEARQRDNALGYRMMISKEGVRERTAIRDCPGTTVTIKGLFSTLPVRQKGTNVEQELRRLTRTMQNLYVGNPTVTIFLFDRQSGRLLFEAKGGHSVDEAFHTVYGNVYDHKLERIGRSSWVGMENHCTDDLQILYNNGRIVHDRDLLQKVSKHVRRWRQEKDKSRGKAGFQCPVFILFFNRESTELRNANCLMDETLALFPLSATVTDNEMRCGKDSLLPCLGGKVSLSAERENSTSSSISANGAAAEHAKSDPFASTQFLASLRKGSKENSQVLRRCKSDSVALMEGRRRLSNFVIDRETLGNTRAIAQFDRKFILCKVISSERDGRPCRLLIFDQHAVSERILLERLLRGKHAPLACSDIEESSLEHVQQGKVTKARLEETLSLPATLFLRHQELLRRYGVDWQETNGRALVQTLPLCFLERRASRESEEALHFLRQLVDQVSEMPIMPTPQTLVPVVRSAFNELACKGAVKFGDQLNVQYCQYLIDELASCQTPFSCAHGRRSFFQLYDFGQFEKH